MEGLAPPLELLLVIKRTMEKGQPVRQGLQIYLKNHRGEFSDTIARWWALLQQGKSTADYLRTLPSMHRQVLLQLLERGLAGEGIYNTLVQLETELIEACQDEISNKIARLPFLLLVPLLVFQFPAFLMLLFGPLLQNFFHSLGSG